ncbi:MAG: surface antigen [Gammaproteobacteria bacterium]
MTLSALAVDLLLAAGLSLKELIQVDAIAMINSHNSISARLLLTLSLLSFSVSALANASWFARESAVAHMTKKDTTILTTAMDNLLNNQPDGARSSWENPASSASGRLAVGKTHQDYGTTCRMIKMENTAKSITRTGTYQLCKDAEGTWRFAPTGQAK